MDIQGASIEIGGSAGFEIYGVGVYLAGEWIVTQGDNKYYGWSAGGGVCAGLPFDTHIQFTYSTVSSTTTRIIIRIFGGMLSGWIMHCLGIE